MATIDESKLPPDLGEGSSEARPKDTTWGLFGDRYELGTLNFLTPERVAAAARLVKTGKRFDLNLPLNKPGTRAPGLYGHKYLVLTEGAGAGQLDEVLDNFNTQGSTQWDGLGHVHHPRFGFYNGVKAEEVVPGDASKLSIGKWTQLGGVIGRGVLLDVPRYAAANGVPFDPRTRVVITVEMVKAIAAWEKVEIKAGDILLVRSGSMRDESSGGGSRPPGSPGLGPGREMAAFLWEKRVAAVAGDSGGVEASPIDPTGPRSMHMALLPMMGMPLGELFVLDELAEDCAKDKVYEFMFISVPLKLPGGIASPANAIAIK